MEGVSWLDCIIHHKIEDLGFVFVGTIETKEVTGLCYGVLVMAEVIFT